jgi:hypothetical protein
LIIFAKTNPNHGENLQESKTRKMNRHAMQGFAIAIYFWISRKIRCPCAFCLIGGNNTLRGGALMFTRRTVPFLASLVTIAVFGSPCAAQPQIVYMRTANGNFIAVAIPRPTTFSMGFQATAVASPDLSYVRVNVTPFGVSMPDPSTTTFMVLPGFYNATFSNGVKQPPTVAWKPLVIPMQGQVGGQFGFGQGFGSSQFGFGGLSFSGSQFGMFQGGGIGGVFIQTSSGAFGWPPSTFDFNSNWPASNFQANPWNPNLGAMQPNLGQGDQ